MTTRHIATVLGGLTALLLACVAVWGLVSSEARGVGTLVNLLELCVAGAIVIPCSRQFGLLAVLFGFLGASASMLLSPTQATGCAACVKGLSSGGILMLQGMFVALSGAVLAFESREVT